MQEPTLTEEDKKMLRQELKTAFRLQVVFAIVLAVMLQIAIANLVFNWWSDTVTVLLFLFAVMPFIGSIVSIRNYNKLKNDINGNVKKIVSGVIEYKRIGKGKTSYFFERNYIEEIAAYQEDQKAAINKDYGKFQPSLAEHSRLDFYIQLTNKEEYTIGAKNYLLIEAGDTVVLEAAPRSNVVFRFAKA